MKAYVITAFFAVTTIVFMYCTKRDQVIGGDSSSTTNSTVLTSYKTTTAPTIDGTIDAIWSKATKLNITPTVPDPGNGLFTGYNGDQYSVQLRSMYDAQNIYFLAEVTDANQSVNVAPWYFDPNSNVTGKTGWQKEPTSRTFDVNGNVLREGWGEDKLAMLWNIDFSTPLFIGQTCYASCHVFAPYMDYSKNPAVYTSNANNGNHYTNGAYEKIDMWWARLGYVSKDKSLNLMDDNYQDWAGGPSITNLTGGNANGRHVDGIVPDGTASTTWPYRPNYTVSPTQGEVSNSQSLKLDGTGATVSVPLWVIPGSNTNFIMVSDTASGTAKKVIGVSSSGVLILSDSSTIDPTVGTDYQRSGDPVTGPTAAKSIAAYLAVPLIGGRADITCSAVYTGTGWIIEYKRALKTGDTLKQDVDFSSLADQQFGLAYWNQSNNQHGIQPNLTLTFQK
ncbi:MAG TPA: ethylbenzene dehydrogenase-related protein [Puia sp.]|nr:ethylbenzene dehydrogenase-related protein [Puia sp.]